MQRETSFKSLRRTLEIAASNNINVMLMGLHGVGKTEIIKSVFEANGLKWRYFSSSTMDPWTDLIGIPRERTEGDLTYLELVRPRDFAEDTVEAIFFDELNRAPKKVLNAVMELIQFKSINGKKFENLKMIWAAINPDDDEASYHVEELDPAQLDRFQIQIQMPYDVDVEYFKEKHGANGDIACTWWRRLPKECKKLVSPRRLDNALQYHTTGIPITALIDLKANPSALMTELAVGGSLNKLKELLNKNSNDEIKKLLHNDNVVDTVLDYILSKGDVLGRCLPLMRAEKQAALFTSHQQVKDHVIKNPIAYMNLLKDLNDVGALDKKLSEALNSHLNYVEPFNHTLPLPKYEPKPVHGLDARQLIHNTYTMAYINEPSTDLALEAVSNVCDALYDGSFEEHDAKYLLKLALMIVFSLIASKERSEFILMKNDIIPAFNYLIRYAVGELLFRGYGRGDEFSKEMEELAVKLGLTYNKSKIQGRIDMMASHLELRISVL